MKLIFDKFGHPIKPIYSPIINLHGWDWVNNLENFEEELAEYYKYLDEHGLTDNG